MSKQMKHVWLSVFLLVTMAVVFCLSVTAGAEAPLPKLTYTPESNTTVTTYGTAVSNKKVGTVSWTNLDAATLSAEITTAAHDGLTIALSGKDVVVSATAAANAGTYNFKVKSSNPSCTDVTGSFTIAKKTLTDSAVSKIEDEFWTGDYITPQVTVKDGSKTLTAGTGHDYTVSYDKNKNAGKAKVTVTLQGNYTGSITKEFDILVDTDVPGAVEVSFGSNLIYYTGEELEPSFTVKAGGVRISDKYISFIVYSDNIDAGTATVRFYVDEESNLISGTFDQTFTITPKTLTAANVEDIPDQEKTGNEIKPEITVKDGDTVLTKGVDYDLSDYKNNVNVGTNASFKITYKGNYQGSATIKFTIKEKAKPTDKNVTVADATYTGAALKPAVTVKVSSGTLTLGTDYTVSYTDNINVGDTAKAIITFKGEFAGTVVEKTFTIKPKVMTAAAVESITEQEYTGKAVEPALTVKDGNKLLTQDVDYTVTYANNIEEGTATAKVTFINNYTNTAEINKSFTIYGHSYTIEELEDQTYTGEKIVPEFIVLDNGNVLSPDNYTVSYFKNVDAGTAKMYIYVKATVPTTLTATFTILPKPMKAAAVADIARQEYTGKAIEPVLTVMDGNKELELDVDYTVEFKSNVALGKDTAQAIVTFIGNYTGTVTKKFTIYTYTIADVANQTYTGAEIKPQITVFDNDTVLTESVDYDVKYTNNVNVGTTATITVTFKAPHVGTLTKTFKIVPKTMTADAVAAIARQEYTGKAITPVLTVKDGEKTLVSGTDYTVAYKNNVALGKDTAEAVVTFIGNYTGTVTKKFTIYTYTIADIADQTYTGAALKPQITVFDNDTVLKENMDYVVSYTDNVVVGSATVTVTLLAPHAGTLTNTFTIVPKPMTADAVESIARQEYTGKAIKPVLTVKDGDKVLTLGTDYSVEYSNNINEGQATVTVTFMGNYTGTVSKNFTIYAYKIATISDQTYTGSYIKPQVVVFEQDTVLTEGADYSVLYDNRKNVGLSTVTVTLNGTRVKLTQTFTIVPKTMTADDVEEIERQEYTGEAVTPEITVNNGKNALKVNTDYTVTYQNNVEEGEATVTVTFIGNYTGSVTKTFTILDHHYSMTEIMEQTYTGYELKPKVIVYDNDEIVLPTNYVVSYTENVNVGTATALIKMKAPYEGEFEVQFAIVSKKTVRDVTVEMADSVVFTGYAIKQNLIVKDAGMLLQEGDDYTVSYTDNVNVGTATLTITLCRNHEGSVTKTFAITQKAMTKDAISMAPDVVYNGTAFTPDVTVTDGAFVLVEGVDYDKKYLDNVNVGEASILITFKGNYSGRAFREFQIAKCSADALEGPFLSQYAFLAADMPHKPDVTVLFNGVTLTDREDYSVSYENNVEPGIAHATVTLKGNFTGSLTVDYVITTAMISSEAELADAPVASMATDGGFHPAIVLKAEAGAIDKKGNVTDMTPIKTPQALCGAYEKVAAVYSVSLQKDGVTIQPNEVGSDNPIILALLLPDELYGKSFRLFHVHGENDVRELTCATLTDVGSYVVSEYGYVLTQVSELSDFVFVYQPTCSFHWIASGIAGLYILFVLLFAFGIFRKKWVVFVAGGLCAVGAAGVAVHGGCILCLYFACGVGGIVLLGTLYTIFRDKLFGNKPEKPAKKKDAASDVEDAASAEEPKQSASVDPYDNATAGGDDSAASGITATETADGKQKRHRRTKAEMEAARAAEAAANAGEAEQAASEDAVDEESTEPEAAAEPEEKGKRHRRTKAEMEAARAEEAARLEEMAAQGIVPEEKEKRHRRTKAEMEAARAEEAARLEELAAQGIVPEVKEKRHRRTKAEMEAARAAEAAGASDDNDPDTQA